jgi:hypothetical protein
MHEVSRRIIAQIVSPSGPVPGAEASPVPAPRPFTIAQIISPRGPSELAAEVVVRVDSVSILPPAPEPV